MEASGKVHLYTGNGKGKTTAAIGLAVRAAGAGWPVFVGHFIKSEPTSEHAALGRLSEQITVAFFGDGRLIGKTPTEADRASAAKGVERCRQEVKSGRYRLVVCDEILVAASLGLVAEKKLLEMMADRPDPLELVLTGRGATPNLIAAADLVTEMREIKHYFQRGVAARVGIEK